MPKTWKDVKKDLDRSILDAVDDMIVTDTLRLKDKDLEKR
jgi:hypothetical protein